MSKYMIITTKSPGGQCYRFQMKDNDNNREKILNAERDPSKMRSILAGMKSNGLMPMDEQNPSSSVLNAKSSRSISTVTKANSFAKNGTFQAGKARPASTINTTSNSEIANKSVRSEKKDSKKPASALRVDDLYYIFNIIYNTKYSKTKTRCLGRLRLISAPLSHDHVHNSKDTEQIMPFRLFYFAFMQFLDLQTYFEIMKRPPLYDFTMDPKYRNPNLKFSLFVEIGELLLDEMEVNLSTKVIENTWTHYKGLHTQYRNLLNAPSGSGGGRTAVPFLHMDVLAELDSVTQKRDQFSSLSGQRFDPPKSRKSNSDEIGPLIKNASQLIADLNKSTHDKEKEATSCKRPFGLVDTDTEHSFFFGLLPDLKKIETERPTSSQI